MNILSTILPVFIMIFIGFFSNRKKLITEKQANGMSSIIYKILFPVMVFNAIFTSDLESSAIFVVAFVFLIHIFGLFIGKISRKFMGSKYAHLSPYLMSTVDGGNICFPLYATIVGSSYVGNIILLDMACMLIVFLVIPLLVSTTTNQNTNIKSAIKNVFHNPIVLTVVLGFLLKQIGLYDYVSTSDFHILYTDTVSMITAPIISMILFMIGFQFKIERSDLVPLLKCVVGRFIIMGIAIITFFTVFPSFASDYTLLVAVILYFMCPPALVLQSQIKDVFQSEKDGSFISAFISIYMIITLIVYTLIIIFV